MNLSQGFPDFPAPGGGEGGGAPGHRRRRQPVRDHLGRALAARRPSPRKFERLYGVPVDPEREVTVTCGSTEAMIATLLAVLDPGDEVVVFEPFYENYGPDAILSGAVPRFVKLRPPDWTFDPRRAARAPSRRSTRAIIVNTPNNPTGKVFTRAELETIAGAVPRARRAGRHRRDLRAHPLRRRRARPDGHAARDGRAHGHHQRHEQDLQRHRLARGLGHRAARRSPRAIRKVHDFLTVGAAAPLQEAGALALALPDAYYDDAGRGLHAAARPAARRSSRRRASAPTGPRGAYYVMTEIDGLGWDDDVAFARHLVEEVGVAVVPGLVVLPATPRTAGARCASRSARRTRPWTRPSAASPSSSPAPVGLIRRETKGNT